MIGLSWYPHITIWQLVRW